MTATAADTFTIPTTAWADFVAKIAKLNRKAKRLGCEPIAFDVVGETEVEREHTYKTTDGERTRRYRVKARTITLRGSAPKLDGWQFVARVEYLSDAKSTLFHTVPGCDIKIDERFRGLDARTCEHCNKSRSRRDTFIVRNVETGVQTQVGRQCLADFTGINTPEKIAGRASWLSTFEDLRGESERSFGAHFALTLDTMHVLALTSAYIALCGWTPRSATEFGGRATADMVGEHFWIRPAADKRTPSLSEASAVAELPEHQDRAVRVVTWVKGELSTRAHSDYERNLVTLVANDLIETKHLGIVCSAVAAYQRAMNQAVEYTKRNESRAASDWVGKVGERLRGISGKVEFVKVMASDWGASTLVKFVTDDGNLLTWFASSDRDFVPGARVVITGTVKAHKAFRDVRETQLSRCVVDVAQASAEAA